MQKSNRRCKQEAGLSQAAILQLCLEASHK